MAPIDQRTFPKSRTFLLLLMATGLALALFPRHGLAQTGKDAQITVKKTADFELDGKGTASDWEKTDWIDIPQKESRPRLSGNIAPEVEDPIEFREYETRFKVLYSDTGIYFLFNNEDDLLQATMEEDFLQLWWEDVVEVFLWPDEEVRTYFEYQLSPLNYELVLALGADDRGRSAWQPFMYEGERQTRHMTSVEGGEKRTGASIESWTAEFFLPWRLLHPAANVPPESGTTWRANLYRLDYDTGDVARWAWQPVEGTHHDLDSYGTFLFE